MKSSPKSGYQAPGKEATTLKTSPILKHEITTGCTYARWFDCIKKDKLDLLLYVPKFTCSLWIFLHTEVCD